MTTAYSRAHGGRAITRRPPAPRRSHRAGPRPRCRTERRPPARAPRACRRARRQGVALDEVAHLHGRGERNAGGKLAERRELRGGAVADRLGQQRRRLLGEAAGREHARHASVRSAWPRKVGGARRWIVGGGSSAAARSGAGGARAPALRRACSIPLACRRCMASQVARSMTSTAGRRRRAAASRFASAASASRVEVEHRQHADAAVAALRASISSARSPCRRCRSSAMASSGRHDARRAPLRRLHHRLHALDHGARGRTAS